MKRTQIDRAWEIMKGEPSNMPGMSAEKKPVDLPHDFMIETDVTPDSVNGPNTGFYNGGTATYTKYIDAPGEWADKRILVSFDGVFGAVKVILNGHVMGRHHYGYTPFTVDLTREIKPGKKNRLAVVVSNSDEQNCRWYSGAGIYRHVNLLTAPELHIAPDGIFAHTDHIVGEDAFVVVETTVENHTAEDEDVWVALEFQRLRENGERELIPEDGAAACGAIKVHVPAGSSETARTQIMVEQAALWDIDHPDLYQVTAKLVTKRPVFGKKPCADVINAGAADAGVTDAEILDTETTRFGIRTISVDSKNGFMLNGRSVKLKGGCIHHDNGILGAASFRDSEYRKVMLHKKNGYNALRFAHNPVSSDMLDACDRLGIVVIDEAFDTWNMSKNYFDFSQYFEQEWQQELTNFVVRDRNHPSVVFWSIGNELQEQGGLSDGYHTSAKLAEHVRKLDSTRFVAGALCSLSNGLDDEDTGKFWQSLMGEVQKNGGVVNNLDGKYGRDIWNDYTESFVAPWDVVGYNYLNYHYEEAGELFPNRVICCTESKPREMESYWADVEKYPYLIGDFEWTSHDYIGEAGIGKKIYAEPENAASAAQASYQTGYPWRLAGAGEFDLCGFEKPQLAYRRIIWGSKETYIACHNPENYGKVEILGRYGWSDCANSWTWRVEEGSPVKVEVYSSAEEVELVLNGRSIGRQAAGKENHNRTVFELEYERGTLEAVSYTAGKEVSRDCVKSAGKPAGILITQEKIGNDGTKLFADGQSLVFARVEIVDDEGNLIPYAEEELTAEAEGAATLAAFGSARPMTEENYTIGRTITYQGRVLAILRAGYEPGEAKLTVRAEGVPEAVLTLVLEPNGQQ